MIRFDFHLAQGRLGGLANGKTLLGQVVLAIGPRDHSIGN